jgi:hypothetical protein
MNAKSHKIGILGRIAGLLTGISPVTRDSDGAPCPHLAVVGLNTFEKADVSMGTFLEIPYHQEPATLGSFANYFHPYQGDGAACADDQAGY